MTDAPSHLKLPKIGKGFSKVLSSIAPIVHDNASTGSKGSKGSKSRHHLYDREGAQSVVELDRFNEDSESKPAKTLGKSPS